MSSAHVPRVCLELNTLNNAKESAKRRYDHFIWFCFNTVLQALFVRKQLWAKCLRFRTPEMEERMKNQETTSVCSMSVGKRIRFFRKQQHLSLEELAARVYMTKQNLSLIENDIADIKVSTLRNIAGALGGSIHALIDDEYTKNDEPLFLESEEEREMLGLFRKGSLRDRKIMLEQMKAFYKY